MQSATHTNFQRGKRVFVIMRDGSKFIDKFKQSKARHIVLENSGRVAIGNIRSITIAR